MCSSQNTLYFYIHTFLFASLASWPPCWRLLNYHSLWAVLLDLQVWFSCISVRMPSAAVKHKTVTQSTANSWAIYYFIRQEMHKCSSLRVVWCSDLSVIKNPAPFWILFLPQGGSPHDYNMAAVVPDITARHSSVRGQKEPVSPDFHNVPQPISSQVFWFVMSSFACT